MFSTTLSVPELPDVFVVVVFSSDAVARDGDFVAAALPVVSGSPESVAEEEGDDEPPDETVVLPSVWFVSPDNGFPVVLRDVLPPPSTVAAVSLSPPGPPQAVNRRHIPANKAPPRRSMVFLNPNSSWFSRLLNPIIGHSIKKANRTPPYASRRATEKAALSPANTPAENTASDEGPPCHPYCPGKVSSAGREEAAIFKK